MGVALVMQHTWAPDKEDKVDAVLAIEGDILLM